MKIKMQQEKKTKVKEAPISTEESIALDESRRQLQDFSF
jgi:hypothetical protein